ncbi:hypothetical protein BKA63DRAFT_594111 [Paraphoma chrysanthemicola]|nr:hypothetical protein BKA63DRAFT_594111 [Paraphoma chrysanthemicola]
MADPRKTRRQADALIARNREQSPLLRLPGELRNKIYQHLFSNLILDLIKVDHGGQPKPRLAVRKASSSNTVFQPSFQQESFRYSFTSVRAWGNIMFASRQLYTDTHLLLFEVASLQVNEALGHRTVDVHKVLRPAQVNVISVIRLCHRNELITAQDPSSTFTGTSFVGMCFCAGCVRQTKVSYQALKRIKLDQFPGLKKVILEGCPRVIDKFKWAREIKDDARKEDLEIVFDYD